MNAIIINHELNIATHKLLRDYCDPYVNDINSSVETIKQVYLKAAEHGLMYALDQKGIDKKIRAGLPATGKEDPEKFIQLLSVFPFIAQGSQKDWVVSMGDAVYQAWAHALMKCASYASHKEPRLMLNIELKNSLKYAVEKNDGALFAEAMKLIEWAFDEQTVKVSYMDVFMRDLLLILEDTSAHHEIDAILADFLSEISCHAFSDSDVPAMGLKYLEQLASLGYKETTNVIFSYYTPTPDDPGHLCRIKQQFGHAYSDEMLNKVITLDTQGIRLDLAPALVVYKLSQGHEQGYALIFQNLKKKDDEALQSILIDVLKHQFRPSPPFISFLSELIEVAKNEQPLIKTVIEHGWGDYLQQQMKAEPRLRRHILGHEMGL